MSDKKNIDRIYQEKFRNFEEAPDDRVWQKIESSLHSSEEDKKPVAIWWTLGGVAAALLLLFTISQFYFSDDGQINETNTPLVDVDKRQEENSSTENEDNIINRRSDQTKNTVSVDKISDLKEQKNSSRTNNTSSIVSSQVSETSVDENLESSSKNSVSLSKNGQVVASSTNVDSQDDRETSIEKPVSSNNSGQTVVANIDSGEENTKKSFENINDPTLKPRVTDNSPMTDAKIASTDSKKDSPSERTENSSKDVITSLKENKSETLTEHPTDVNKSDNVEAQVAALTEEDLNLEDSIEKEKEIPEFSRWNISPNVSPVYFNSLGNGSSLDSQFNDNTKSGDINFSYGITGSYAISEKVRLRAGVNNVTLGYSTKDVILTQNISSAQVSRLSHVNMRSEVEASTTIMSASQLNTSAIPDIIFANPKGSLDQELGFIEVPLELEYNLLDKIVGINVIGGFSTYFLNRNEVYSSLRGQRQFLGEANNVNDVSYSANFGLGMDFHLSRKWDLNFEPTFKYQINTFSDSSGDFRPYFIGLYSGIRFKF